MSSAEILSAFQDRFDPKDKAARKLLGLGGEKLAEFFQAAVHAVDSETLTIPDLNKLGKKLMKTPSVSISEMKKRKLVASGKKRGEWSISKTAIGLMEAFLKGEKAANTEEDSPARGKNKKKTRAKRITKKLRRSGRQSTRGPKPSIDSMTFGQIDDRLEEIASQIDALIEERTAIVKRVEVMVGGFQKHKK